MRTYIRDVILCWTLTAAACASCAGRAVSDNPELLEPTPEPPASHVDQVWTDDPTLKPVVRRALTRWAAATGREWAFEPGPRTVSFGVIPPELIGWNDGTKITLDPSWAKSVHLDALVLHEVGHYYSASHVYDRHSIMHHGLADQSCLTYSDIYWACSHYSCSVLAPECYLLADGTLVSADDRQSMRPPTE